MATRLYLPSTGTAQVSPAFDAAWTITNQALVRPLPRTHTNTATTATTIGKSTVGAKQNVLHAQFVSAPLTSAATIAGTVSMAIGAVESDTNAQAYLQVVIRVVSGDGTTTRGTLLAASTAGVSNVSSNPNYEYSDIASARYTRILNAVALTSVAAQAGDRIVVAIGTRHDTVSTVDRTATLWIGDPTGVTDAPLTVQTATYSNPNVLYAPWVEFSQDLTIPVDPGPSTFTVPAGTVNLSAPSPTLRAPMLLQPPAGTVALSNQPPSLKVGVASIYSVPAGAVSLTGQPPDRLMRLGDGPGNPVYLTGNGGVATMDLTIMGASLMPVVYGVLEHAAWWRLDPAENGEFVGTITGPTGWSGVLEVYERDAGWTSDFPWADAWPHYLLLGAAAPGQTVTVATTAGKSVYVRIHPFYTNDAVPDAQMTWSHAARIPVPAVTVHTTLMQAPGSVLISLGEVPADQTVVVSILDSTISNPVLITETGADGTTEFSLPVPTLPAGTYQFEIVIDTVTLLGELTVLADPLDDTTPDQEYDDDDYPHDDDNNDYEGAARKHPRHWKFKDKLTGKDFYFPHNPASWEGIERPNWFEYDSTTAPDGQELVWQAAGRAQPFEFHGYLDTHEFYHELVFWSRLRRRFWLRDHRNRWWYIAIEQFDPRRRVVPNKPWAHDYTMRCVQFMGPMGESRDVFDDEDDSYDDHRHNSHDEV